MAEDLHFNNFIKKELTIDDEDCIVYNILEEPEDSIYYMNDDPLLSLTPVVYTTRLDDMNTIKTDLSLNNLNAKEILRKLHSESIPRMKAEHIKPSSNSINLESFIRLAGVINEINFKDKNRLSTSIDITPTPSIDITPTPSSSSDSSANKQENTELIQNSEIEPLLKLQISTNPDMSPNFDAASDANSTDVCVKKECRPCFIVLHDIKKLLPATQPVKIDSHNRIVYEVIVKVEEEENQNSYSEVDTETVLSDSHNNQMQISNEIENTISDETVLITEINQLPADPQKQSTETKEISVAKLETKDDSANIQSSVKTKRKRKQCVLYEDASSDEDYVPVVKLGKKSKTNKNVTNWILNSDPKIVPNVVKVYKNKSKTVRNTVSSSNTVSKTVPSSNTVSKTVPNTISSSKAISNNASVTIVTNEAVLTIQEKYALIVLTNIKINKTFVYRVNPTRLVTDYYITRDCDEYKLAALYPKEEKIIDQYCCWYKRDEIISKICARKNYPFVIQKVLKQPHTCHPEECHCCCYQTDTDTSQSKQKEKRNVTIKSLAAADTWIRGLLNKTNISTGLVSKALTYTPQANKQKPIEQSEKYLENYLLCLRNCNPNIEDELYEIGQNGNILRSSSLNNKEEVKRIRKTYQKMSMPIRDAELCCWFKREKLMHELKMLKTSPATLKYIQRAHWCNYKKCSCCCKPLPVTLQEVLPSTFNQTVVYEKNLRPLSIQFSAKSKNAMVNASENYDKSKNITKTAKASTAAIILSGCASKDDNLDLSISILRKFKNLKLGISNDGVIEAVLDEPAKKLSVAELKVLSDILALSTKQIVDLGLSAEEFCNRINSKSGDIIRVTTLETPLIRTEEVAPPPTPPLQDHNDDDGIDIENVNLENESVTNLPNQTAQIRSTNSLCQTRPSDPPRNKVVPVIKLNTKSVSSMFTSISNLMTTKNKNYVASFKSFFNKTDASNISLPNINRFSPVSKPVGTIEAATTVEVSSSMPIIKETFTLAQSSSEGTIVAIPGPSGVVQQRGIKMPSSVRETIPGSNSIELFDSNQTNMPITNTHKHKLKHVIHSQIEKKIRVKPPSELNAPIPQESINDNAQSNLTSGWPAPIVLKREPQTNIHQIVRPVTSTDKTNSRNIVATNVTTASSLKIVSPVRVKKVIHRNLNPINVNENSLHMATKIGTDVNGVHYMTLSPFPGTNTVNTSNTSMLAKFLNSPQPQPGTSTSDMSFVPPLVPIRPGGIIPVSMIKDTSDQTQDGENFTYTVMQHRKKL